MNIMNRNNNNEPISIEDVATKIENGHFGMLSFFNGYKINDIHCYAHGLTLFPKETKIFTRNEKIIVTAYFKEIMLPRELRTGDDERLVLVECELDPHDKVLVSFSE